MSNNQQAANRTIQDDGHLHGVIVACRRDDDRWLMIRRSANVPSPLKICFPGGGIDFDESQQQTAKREMREELGAIVLPLECLWHGTWPEKKLTLWGWYAQLQSNHLTPNPDEVEEILWLTEREILTNAEVMPGTDTFLQALINHINASA